MFEKNFPNLKTLAEKWPSAYVARHEVKAFTGGIISGGYLANLDSQGLGPQGRIKVGGKTAYPVDSFIMWLEARAVGVGS